VIAYPTNFLIQPMNYILLEFSFGSFYLSRCATNIPGAGICVQVQTYSSASMFGVGMVSAGMFKCRHAQCRHG